MCSKEFLRNCDLEHHLEEHNKMKQFQCNECGKEFFLEWRLNKHTQSHHEATKFCHYFNNEKSCPYEIIGCMFQHANSGRCRRSVCNNSLCQFKHKAEEHENDAHEFIVEHEVVETLNESNSEMKDDDEVEYGENDCHLCDMKFSCLDYLCDHLKSNHQEYHQNIVRSTAERRANQIQTLEM